MQEQVDLDTQDYLFLINFDFTLRKLQGFLTKLWTSLQVPHK